MTCSLLLAGCGDKKPKPPKDLIPEDQYINMLVDYEMVQSYEFMHGDSAHVQQLVDSVMHHYGATREQFMRSHAYYQKDVKAQKKRFNKAIEQLRKEMVRLEDQRQGKDSASRDSTLKADSTAHSTQ